MKIFVLASILFALFLLFSMTGNIPHEVSKAVIQARLLSGKYRFERFKRHYSNDNPEGLCSLNMCQGVNAHEGNIESFFREGKG